MTDAEIRRFYEGILLQIVEMCDDPLMDIKTLRAVAYVAWNVEKGENVKPEKIRIETRQSQLYHWEAALPGGRTFYAHTRRIAVKQAAVEALYLMGRYMEPAHRGCLDAGFYGPAPLEHDGGALARCRIYELAHRVEANGLDAVPEAAAMFEVVGGTEDPE